MSRLKIWIDAGHGGSDPGASKNNLQEKEITLDISLRLGALLAADFDVMHTRTDDRAVSIEDRWKAANTAKADFFVAIHVNAGGGTGCETFYYREDSERSRRSEALAKAINDFYAESMGLRNRGIKPDTQTSVGSIGVLRRTTMPAILVELAFVDCPASSPDVAILQGKRAEIAQALSQSIYKHFGMTPTPPPPPTPASPEPIYRVQVGAFRQKTNAEALVLLFKKQGFDAFVVAT